MAPVEPFIAIHRSSKAGNVSHFKAQHLIESVWVTLFPANPSAVPSPYCSDSKLFFLTVQSGSLLLTR